MSLVISDDVLPVGQTAVPRWRNSHQARSMMANPRVAMITPPVAEDGSDGQLAGNIR